MPTKRPGRRERESIKRQRQRLQMAAANNPYELVKALGKEGLLAIFDPKSKNESKTPTVKPELKVNIQNDSSRQREFNFRGQGRGTHRGSYRGQVDRTWKGRGAHRGSYRGQVRDSRTWKGHKNNEWSDRGNKRGSWKKTWKGNKHEGFWKYNDRAEPKENKYRWNKDEDKQRRKRNKSRTYESDESDIEQQIRSVVVVPENSTITKNLSEDIINEK